jgi:hypothetical protein
MNLNWLGSWRSGTNRAHAVAHFAGLMAVTLLASGLAGCGGGGGGSNAPIGPVGPGGGGGASTVTLQGVVTDGGTNPPLPMPNVTVKVDNSNPSISTVTNASGAYSLPGVPASSNVTLDVDYMPTPATPDYTTGAIAVGTATPQTVNITFTPPSNPPPPAPPL